MRVVAGVDCHKATHTIVLVDEVGRVLDQFTISSDKDGYAQALARSRTYDDVVWGLEGTGSYGRAFADALSEADAIVYEVPGAFTKRHRKHASRHGKSDALDAHAIAEAVLRESARLPRYAFSDERETIRLKYDRRDRLVRQRTEAVNRVQTTALRLELANLPKILTTASGLKKITAQVATLRGRTSTQDELIAQIEESIEDIVRLSATVAKLERELRPFVERLAPELLRTNGVSVVVAAGLIGHAGALVNYRNAAAFAMRAGVAPIECSSGRSQSVRLNLGGDRQLNRLLHVIALVQIRKPEQLGRIYYDRKRSEGKTHRAALRALKRQLATVVFYRLRPMHGRLTSRDGELKAA